MARQWFRTVESATGGQCWPAEHTHYADASAYFADVCRRLAAEGFTFAEAPAGPIGNALHFAYATRPDGAARAVVLRRLVRGGDDA